MKKIAISTIMVLLVFTTLFSGIPAKAATSNRKAVKIEKGIKKKYKRIRIIRGDGSEKFWNKIEHRKGKSFYYVEKVTGTVINKKGDGVAEDGYINYRRVKGIKPDSKVVSWFVYSRNNNAWDDIIARYDLLIKK